MSSWIIESSITAALLAGSIAFLSRALRPPPALRHALWLVVLVKLLLPPVVAWPFTVPEVPLLAGLFTAGSDERPASAVDGPFHAPPGPDGEETALADRSPEGPFGSPSGLAGGGAPAASIGSHILGLGWVAGALALAGLEGVRILRLRRVLARSQPAPGRIEELVAELSLRLGVRSPRTLIAGLLPSPALASLGRARLLIPRSLIERLDEGSLRSVIAHELAHLRRKDHWIGWLELAGGIVWWWNPVYWIARRQLRHSSELCCDAWVVWALPGGRRAYAETLIDVCRLFSPARAPVLARGMANGAGTKFFKKRLTMILLHEVPCKAPPRGLLIAVLIALAALPGWPGCSNTVAPAGPAQGAPAAAAPPAAPPAREAPSAAPSPVTGTAEEKAPPAPRPPEAAAPPSATAGAAAAPAEPAALPAPAASGDCQKKLAEIRQLFAAIPDDYRQASSIEDLVKTVKACRERSEDYLKTCPDTAEVHEVQLALARCILSMNRMEWLGFVNEQREKGRSNAEVIAMRDEWVARYFGRAIELASAALARFEVGTPLRLKCLDLLGDSHYQAGQAQKALERYLQLLKENPDYPNRASVYLAMARCYQDLGRFQEGIALIRKAIAELPHDPSFPNFYESLWMLHLGAGDLAGLLKVVEETRTVLPPRLKDPAVSKMEKDAIDRVLAYSGFRLGYVRFALGDFPGAADAFHDHIAYLEELGKKGELPQDYQVYRTRSRDNLDVLISQIGKPKPDSLKGVAWAGGRKPDLAPGKPLAIIFRNQGDERSSKFVQALDAYRRKRGDAFDLAVISFMKATGDSELVQLDQAQDEARALGVECPIGLDPDLDGRQVFRSFHATVGSATLAIVDRSGNYVWFQQDPWQRDVGFSTAILERIIGKP
jgi:beta-lactamase regulating signal transducer with metallopeptidase domain/tetratricopeptide (TPR) repeat protein